MKKLAFIFAAAVAAQCFAALDFGGAKMVEVFQPTAISAGATNSVELSAPDLNGTAELVVYATGDINRTNLNVAVWGKPNNEYTVFADKSFTATSGIFRLAFPAEYITRDIKVTVGSIGCDITASAMILTH